MNFQVRSLVIIFLLFLVDFAQSGLLNSLNDNQGHELIMNIEEPIDEVFLKTKVICSYFKVYLNRPIIKDN